MKLVKDKCGKRKINKKLAYANTTPRIGGDVSFYLQHIDSMCHVSETPSDWLTQNDHANPPEVSVSQKSTRGDMYSSAPRGRSRFHPHFLDGAVCFHAVLFWTVQIPSMHGCRGGGMLNHGHVYKETYGGSFAFDEKSTRGGISALPTLTLLRKYLGSL
jgi:hypothetical protein